MLDIEKSLSPHVECAEKEISSNHDAVNEARQFT